MLRSLPKSRPETVGNARTETRVHSLSFLDEDRVQSTRRTTANPNTDIFESNAGFASPKSVTVKKRLQR